MFSIVGGLYSEIALHVAWVSKRERCGEKAEGMGMMIFIPRRRRVFNRYKKDLEARSIHVTC